MSRLDDYRYRTTLSRFSDEELEALITGGPSPDTELDDLALLLTEMRGQNMTEPAPDEVERMARRAAAIARSISAAARITPPATRRRSPLTALRAYSSVAVAILALVTFSGLGLAANAAVPGDFLYGLDLAMEKVGIGAGALQERISEAQVLAESGDHEAAVDHLTTSIVEADDAAPGSLTEALDSLDEYTAILEANSPQDQGNPGNNNAGGNSDNNIGNETTGPGNNNAGGNSDIDTTGPGNHNSGNETPEPGNNNSGGNSGKTPGPGNNNSGGNSNETPGPGNNNSGGDSGNETPGPGNNNAGGNSGKTPEPGNNNAGGNSGNGK